MTLVAPLVGVIAALVPTAAADGMQTACQLVPGGCDASTNILTNFVPPLIGLLVSLIAGLAVLFVVWGGAQMLISLGDESRFGSGRSSVLYGLVGFGISLTAQVALSYVVSQGQQVGGENPLLDTVRLAVDTMLLLLNVTFVIIMIAAGFRFVLAHGKSDEADAARRAVIYAVAGAIVINLARSLVYAVVNIGL